VLLSDPVASSRRLEVLEEMVAKANKVVSAADGVKAEQTKTNEQLIARAVDTREKLSRVLLRESDVTEREKVCDSREAEIKRRWDALVAAVGGGLK
jgi:hypothetical protein